MFSIYHHYLVRSIGMPVSGDDVVELSDMQTAFQRVLQAGLQPMSCELSKDGTEDSSNSKSAQRQLDELEELHPDDPRAADFRSSLRAWFSHAPWSRIRQRELRKWLYWAVFNAVLPETDAELPHAHQTMLAEVVELLRRRTGCVVPEGSDPQCKPLLFTLEPLRAWPRPLVWYLFVAAANALVWQRLKRKWHVQHGRFYGMESVVFIDRLSFADSSVGISSGCPLSSRGQRQQRTDVPWSSYMALASVFFNTIRSFNTCFKSFPINRSLCRSSHIFRKPSSTQTICDQWTVTSRRIDLQGS
jgi:hypothetical protein